MKIQNKHLPDTELSLRFTHDANGERVRVRSDARGVFTMPDREAQVLLGTPGWAAVREASVLEPDALPDAPPAPPTPKPAGLKPAAPGAPAPAPALEEKAEEAGGEEEESDEAEALKAEIDGLRSKADAIAFAELHGVKDVLQDMKLSEMKERLVADLLVIEKGE